MPSYSQSDPFTQLRGQITRAGAPFTISIIAANVLLFLVNYFTGQTTLLLLTACSFIGSTVTPVWGILTYPLIAVDIISLLFSCVVFWWIGSSLERSWGTKRFAGYATMCSVSTAVFVWLGCALLHKAYAMAGLWLVIAPLIVTWAVLNRSQSIYFWTVRIPALVLAALEVVIVYFARFNGEPLLGLFGLVPCALAYFYAAGNWSYTSRGYARRGPDLRISRAASRKQTSVLDGSRPASGGPLNWLRSWQERRRLRKLWRDSGFGD